MAFTYSEFTTTPSGLVAALKSAITASADWSNITGDIVKAVTTRGAQLVVNLNKGSVTSAHLPISMWRTHDGSTGVDELTPYYIKWRSSGGATSDTLYVAVSASKEHLTIVIEGPRAGDTNVVNATNGSPSMVFHIGDLVPYHGGDTIPAACTIPWNATSFSQNAQPFAYVSRNMGDSRSWNPAILLTVSSLVSGNGYRGFQSLAAGDGNIYLWPWLVTEQADGLRGRLADIFFAGFTTGSSFNQNPMAASLAPGMEITYDSKTYKLFDIAKNTSDSAQNYSPAWLVASSVFNERPLLAVRSA